MTQIQWRIIILSFTDCNSTLWFVCSWLLLSGFFHNTNILTSHRWSIVQMPLLCPKWDIELENWMVQYERYRIGQMCLWCLTPNTPPLNVISFLLFVLSFSILKVAIISSSSIIRHFKPNVFLFQVTWSDADEGYGKHYFEFNH